MKNAMLLSAVILSLTMVILTACDCEDCKSTTITYTLTYDGNENTVGTVPVSTTHSEGSTVTVVDNTGNLMLVPPAGTAEAFKFGGWNTQKDGNGTNYEGGSGTFLITGDTTLYVKWVPFELRDSGPAGGWIFHDKGSFSDGWRYMEAAPVSTEWTLKQWGAYDTLIGVTDTAIGTGQAGTTLIVEWLDTNSDDTYGDVTNKTDRAAWLCDALSHNGYDDWFLPSQMELDAMYDELQAYGVGGFYGATSVSNYWCTRELDAQHAYVQGFNDGGQGTTSKFATMYVRSARVF